jgi:hypothetical protein
VPSKTNLTQWDHLLSYCREGTYFGCSRNGEMGLDSFVIIHNVNYLEKVVLILLGPSCKLILFYS